MKRQDRQKQLHSSPPEPGAWVTVQPNLIRYRSSGTYFARLRVRGKLIVKSLKTNRVTVARLRLTDVEKTERQRAEHLTADAAANGKLTFGQALALYRKRLEGDMSIKPRTKDYYNERIAALLKSWPSLKETDVARVTKGTCLDWAAQYAKQASSTNFNNTVLVLRQVIDLAVEAGARYDNPARFIKRAPVRFKIPTLPSPEQFEALLALVKHDTVADLIRFLAYGGFRKSEAAAVTWADVDFDQGRILVRGGAEGTKNGEIRQVPMIPAMRKLIQELQAKQPNRKPEDRVMRARECQGSIDSACLKLGIARFTHHGLRHMFATRCVEAGGSLPAVAKCLGHKDGGVLLAKRYNHVSDDHLSAMAQRVTFGTQKPKTTPDQPQAAGNPMPLPDVQAA
ncbi:MAG TPA: site-specific integrase [Verrucomicrobiae bacterium]|nr:site-specific integrase [Verrucomicrobiae bacterium]